MTPVEPDIDIFGELPDGDKLAPVSLVGVPQKNGGDALAKNLKPRTELKQLPDGTLVPCNVATAVTNDALVATMSQAVNKLYEGRDAKHLGKTKLEAGMDALVDKFAAGDKEAATIVMDRLGGKPAQITKQLTVNTSLEDFLRTLQ